MRGLRHRRIQRSRPEDRSLVYLGRSFGAAEGRFRRASYIGEILLTYWFEDAVGVRRSFRSSKEISEGEPGQT